MSPALRLRLLPLVAAALAAGVAASLSCGTTVRPIEPTDAGDDAGTDGGTDAGTDGGTDAGTCDPLVTKANLPCGQADVNTALGFLRSMSQEEKVQQMSGPVYNPNNMFDQLDNADLGIPGFKYMDGPRGVRWYNTNFGTTVYPVPEARAATFDPELERLIGKGMAREMRALGRHVHLAPTINQVMHPRWGRAQESYGEDSYLLGVMGAAMVTGVQYDPAVSDPADPADKVEDTYRVQSCVKHFAANNVEDTRIFVNAVVDERTLREVYLPHFKRAVDAGASCVMASYNRVNADYSCYNRHNLRDILKGEWGYRGFVISDWFAKGKTLLSPAAGLDVEMPFSSGTFPSQFDSAYFYGPQLITALTAGQVDPKLVDEAALRILYAKVHFGDIAHKPAFSPWLTKSDATQALALRAAREGIVLLKNGPTAALADDVLPLDRSAISKVAVVGKFANAENMGDKGSSDAKVMDGALVITPYEGISAALPGKTVVTYPTVLGNEASIGDADVIVVVSAYFYADLNRSAAGEEGEWKDRVSLALPQRDLDNITRAVALKQARPGMKLVVVTKSGGAVVVKDWIDNVDALIHAWYAGMSEGTALAEILFGDVNPSGRLPQSFPVNETDLPAFHNDTQGDVAYGYYHGYRWLDKQGIKAQYPFGFGLSYTTFSFSNLQLSSPSIAADGTLTVHVDVKNTGPVAGAEVVQLYVGFDNTSVPQGSPPSAAAGWGRPVKELKAFARTGDIAPGATSTVTLTLNAADIAYWDDGAKKFVVEKMVHQLYVGPSSDGSDPDMLKTTFTVQ